MAKVMTVSEARAALPEILDRVEAGEEVTITRHGKAAAVVVRPEALRTRRADAAFAVAERLNERLVEGRARPLDATPGISEERAEELIAEVRASRSRR
ncbi:MAG: type II toxin-antitoxin system Phd/YefM family antitoxin [Actinomycetota bacterium]|jgi:prevent-host-death family protein